MKERICNLVSGLALVGFVATAFYSFATRDRVHSHFSHVAFYLIAALILVWAQQLFAFRAPVWRWIQAQRRPVLYAVLVGNLFAGLLFYSSRPDFRTLSDETNLLGVSKSMLATHTTYNVTMGRYYYENFYPIANEVPIRPLVFPFFTYLMHTVLGYDYRNAFVVNFVALAGLGSALCLLGTVTAGYAAGAGTVLLLAAYPVVAIYGTSAGFDLLSAVFFFLSLLALVHFMREKSAQTFALLWTTLLVFANIRYESIAILVVMIAGLFCGGYLKRSVWWRHRMLLALSPFLLLPLAWQQVLSKGKYENAPGVPLFSFDHFKLHFGEFFQGQFDFNFKYPYASLISLAALGAFCYLVVLAVRRRQVFGMAWARHAWGLVLLCVCAQFTIFLAHHAGTPLHPAQARFFIFIAILNPVLILLARVALPQIRSISLIALGTFSFFLYHPMAVDGRFINPLILNRETRLCMDFLAKQAERATLIIADRPGQFTALGYGAVDFNFANRNEADLINSYQRRLFPQIVVFQRIQYANGLPYENYQLKSAAFRLEILEERQLTGDEFLRISKVLRMPYAVPVASVVTPKK